MQRRQFTASATADTVPCMQTGAVSDTTLSLSTSARSGSHAGSNPPVVLPESPLGVRWGSRRYWRGYWMHFVPRMLCDRSSRCGACWNMNAEVSFGSIKARRTVCKKRIGHADRDQDWLGMP